MPGPWFFEVLFVDASIEEHLARHQVSVAEVYQVLNNGPKWAPNKKNRSAGFLVVGRTDGGRVLTLAVRWEERTRTITPATGRDATPGEVRKYL